MEQNICKIRETTTTDWFNFDFVLKVIRQKDDYAVIDNYNQEIVHFEKVSEALNDYFKRLNGILRGSYFKELTDKQY